jgi:glycosyltransferase involved in cell wall biosynthesis
MIAIVYPQFYGIGGIARYLDSFLSNLPAEHTPIYLITGDEHQQFRHYRGVEIIHIPFKSNRLSLFIWAWQVRRHLQQLHKQRKIQWINFHFPPLIPGLFLPQNIPIVLTAHTTYLGMSGNFYQAKYFESQWSKTSLVIKSWMEKRIFNLTTKVITLTEQGQQEVLSYGFNKSINVIPNGVDLKNFTPTAVEKDIDILFCGRIESRKGSRAMVELCRLLLAKKPNLKIYIVGYGEDEGWVKQELNSVFQNVVMTGKVSFSAMLEYYNRSRVYVSTSYYEGLPGTCLEAMAMQLPAVVWDFPFYHGFVIEGENGHLVKANDFTLMGHRVIELLSDSHLITEMGKKSRALLEEQYNWTKLAQDILNVFQPI